MSVVTFRSVPSTSVMLRCTEATISIEYILFCWPCHLILIQIIWHLYADKVKRFYVDSKMRYSSGRKVNAILSIDASYNFIVSKSKRQNRKRIN